MTSKDSASQSQAVPSELASAAQAIYDEQRAACLTSPILSLNEMARDNEESLVSSRLLVNLFEALFSHSAATGKVPEGWKLVPAKPTAEMLKAGAESEDKDFGLVIHNCYCAMLAASPAAPLAGKAEDEWPTHADLLAEDLEKIAETWTGCMYDAPGETIDIGADLRAAFAKLNLSAPLAAVPAEEAGDEEEPAALPLLPEPAFKSRLNGGMLVRDGWDSLQMFEFARAAITADRESRKASPAEPAPVLSGGLTDERIEQLVPWQSGSADPYDVYFDRVKFARAIEAEVLSRLSKSGAQEAAAQPVATEAPADDSKPGTLTSSQP